LPFGAIGTDKPTKQNAWLSGKQADFCRIPCLFNGNSCSYPRITMSDPNSAFDKPAGMPQEEVGRLLPKTKDDGVPVVMTLPAGARVGDFINNLIYLPGGRTRTLSTTVTQDDIYAGRVSRMMPDLAAE
jgi:hypothetical protein